MFESLRTSNKWTLRYREKDESLVFEVPSGGAQGQTAMIKGDLAARDVPTFHFFEKKESPTPIAWLQVNTPQAKKS